MWDKESIRQRERNNLVEELTVKAKALAPVTAEVLVYMTGRKGCASWYGFYRTVAIEFMLGKASVRHDVSLYSALDNGCGGYDVTGAAHQTVRDAGEILIGLGYTNTLVLEMVDES